MITRLAHRVAIGMVLLLTACQDLGPSAISLDEARRMAAEFQANDFIPPPRTIDDIRKRFGLQPSVPSNCIEIQEKREKAFKQASKPSGENITNWAADFAVRADIEFARGNFKQTIEMLERAHRWLPGSEEEQRRINFLTQLARMQAAIGDVGAAERNMGTTSRLWWKMGPRLGPISRAQKAYFTAVGRAAIAQAKGNLPVAEHYYRTALSYSAGGMSNKRAHVDRFYLWSTLSTNLVQQGRLAEAELVAREGLEEVFLLRFVAVGYKTRIFRSQTAQIVTQLAAVLYEQDRLDDAEYVARTAVTMHEVDCSLPSSLAVVRARQVVAQILAARGDWTGVLEQVEAARRGLADQPELFDHFFGHNATWALAMIHSGRADEGLRPLEKALERAIDREGADSFQAAEARGLLGVAYSLTGDSKRALNEFRAALPGLMRRREQEDWVAGQRARSATEGQILDGYMALLLEVRDRSLEAKLGIDAVSELLRVASLVRSSGLQAALSASATRAAAGDPELAKLVRQQQDSGQALAAAIDTLLYVESAPPDQVDPSLRGQLRERVPALRAAQAALLGEIAARFPDYANLMNPAPPTVAELQSHLAAEEALLVFYALEDRTLVRSKTGPLSGPSRPSARLPFTRRRSAARRYGPRWRRFAVPSTPRR